MSILIFDTETTGLIPRDTEYTDLKKFEVSRIVSICWNIYNTNGVLIKSKYNIIKPTGFIMDDNSIATSIHGITVDIASLGTPLSEVIEELSNDLATVDLLVAHNIHFDKTVLLSELHRLGRDDVIHKIANTNSHCTMLSTTELCALKRPHASGFKWPKLQELHTKLFGFEFIGQHNAAADVEATARCYFRIMGVY